MSYIKGFTDCIQANLILPGNTLSGEAACRDIQIKGKHVILKVDDDLIFKSPVLNTIYKPGQLRCICDYILVSENTILVCELKSNNPGHYKIQLKNSGKLISYLADMIKQHCKIALNHPTIKYVRFANEYKSLKQNQRLDRIPWNNTELFLLPCNLVYHLSQFN